MRGHRLSPAHFKFVNHYCEFGNATQAYLKAFPKVTYKSARELGSNLLTDADIQEYIAQRKEELESASLVTRESLIRDLQEIKAAQKKINSGSSLKAIELMGKMLGYFENKLDITSGGDKITIKLDLSDDK